MFVTATSHVMKDGSQREDEGGAQGKRHIEFEHTDITYASCS